MQTHHQFRNAGVLAGLLLALIAGPAAADDMADITKLLRTGQLAEALDRANTTLGKRPQDPQIRFLKGLILTEQSKAPEAIAVFTKLTEDHPDLPEPYNNLAVLFASSGQYDKARAALDMAIRTNPTYATAHENLGDVYAKLASQAYDKALQIDSGSGSARSKLTLVRNLTGTAGVATLAQASQAAGPVTSQVQKREIPAPASAKDRQEKPVSTVEPASTSASVGSDREAVIDTLADWAKAWSSRDVDGYLEHYASDFKTPKNQSRKTWAEERRSRIEGKGHIKVELESPQISISGDTATARFRQMYSSDRLDEVSRKTVTLVKQSGKWLITQEHSVD